jgi:hypothetical protein
MSSVAAHGCVQESEACPLHVQECSVVIPTAVIHSHQDAPLHLHRAPIQAPVASTVRAAPPECDRLLQSELFISITSSIWSHAPIAAPPTCHVVCCSPYNTPVHTWHRLCGLQLGSTSASGMSTARPLCWLADSIRRSMKVKHEAHVLCKRLHMKHRTIPQSTHAGLHPGAQRLMQRP